jgi:hypothetical protein
MRGVYQITRPVNEPQANLTRSVRSTLGDERGGQYLYQIHVSITSGVKTSPRSRNSWSLRSAANGRLRQRPDEESHRQGIRTFIAPLRLCTDNAVMRAIAVERYRAGRFESLDLDAYPGVIRAKSC